MMIVIDRAEQRESRIVSVEGLLAITLTSKSKLIRNIYSLKNLENTLVFGSHLQSLKFFYLSRLPRIGYQLIVYQ